MPELVPLQEKKSKLQMTGVKGIARIPGLIISFFDKMWSYIPSISRVGSDLKSVTYNLKKPKGLFGIRVSVTGYRVNQFINITLLADTCLIPKTFW